MYFSVTSPTTSVLISPLFTLKTRAPAKIFQNMALLSSDLCQCYSRIGFLMIQNVFRNFNFPNFFSIFVCKVRPPARGSQLLDAIFHFLDRKSKKSKPFRYARFTQITYEKFRRNRSITLGSLFKLKSVKSVFFEVQS